MPLQLRISIAYSLQLAESDSDFPLKMAYYGEATYHPGFDVPTISTEEQNFIARFGEVRATEDFHFGEGVSFIFATVSLHQCFFQGALTLRFRFIQCSRSTVVFVLLSTMKNLLMGK